MSGLHRRALLAGGAGLLGMAVSGAASAAAGPFFKRHGLPIGIQLYTLGPDLAKDVDGTFAQLASIGYHSVELAGMLGKTPKDLRASLDKAGLVCASAHIQARGAAGSFETDLARLADDLTTIGVKTAVMPSPYLSDARIAAAKGSSGADYFRKLMGGMTADDFKLNADYLNRNAAALKKAGIRVGYHNHNFEFAPVGGTTGYEILLKNTDPALVTFEMDIGWVAAAGVDPLALLKAHKGRFTQMHVKDIKADTKANFALAMDPAEIGSGKLAWKTLLPSAYAQGVREFYVEQEPPFTRPRIEAARISHDYLAGVVA
jgi:sugar phosphate isomerase/epimerase